MPQTRDLNFRRHAVDEHRTQLRHRVLKAGMIVFNRAGGIECTVRNLSETGACLIVESPVGIPPSFELVIERDHLARQCEVVWRTEHRIGVKFR